MINFGTICGSISIKWWGSHIFWILINTFVFFQVRILMHWLKFWRGSAFFKNFSFILILFSWLFADWITFVVRRKVSNRVIFVQKRIFLYVFFFFFFKVKIIRWVIVSWWKLVELFWAFRFCFQHTVIFKH